MPRRSRKIRKKRAIVAIVAGVLVMCSIATGVYLWQAYRTIGSTIQNLEEPFPADSSRPPLREGAAAKSQNILILGSDARVKGGVKPVQDRVDQNENLERSDVIMVLNINADRQEAYLVSIMRDNWVDIPGHGEHKINAALEIGGVPLAVETVEDFIGTRIDHVALVDFSGFETITEALGGITIDNPEAFTTAGGQEFAEGSIHLNGESALAFVRERKAFSDGDYSRVRNQQIIVDGMMKKVLTPGVIGNPERMNVLIDSAFPYVAVDEKLTVSYVSKELFNFGLGGKLVPFTSPTKGIDTTPDGQSIVLVDWPKVDVLRKAFQQDDLAGYLATENKSN